jgi:Cof subfamily protein (haloacid dehalogenase superfamily)
MKTIVFSDVDGTLLNNAHQMTEKTREAINALGEQNIPFVIVSARSPSGIYPILKKNRFHALIIAYSGGLILDDDRKVVESRGFDVTTGKAILEFIKKEQFACTPNIYSGDDWIVEDRSDSRVQREENIVEAQARNGSIDDLPYDAVINKILCMCDPTQTLAIEKALKAKFKQVNIAKSSDILIEINGLNITKAHAVKKICALKGIDEKEAIAFGDNFNDEDMLKCVGHPFLMANAPQELLDEIPNHTLSNEEDGIAYALKQLNIIK